ncbi:MAG: GGDEF domain-containing protein [Spongiibacteraceae bacterium]
MKTTPNTALPSSGKPAKSLNKVLDQSEHVKDLVEECAEELASVNNVLQQELTAQHPPGVAGALEQSVVVESKVQDASDKLAVVNRELEHEVKERQILEQQLAVANHQAASAQQAAFHDALTGLPNRVLFNDRLEHGLAQAHRHDWALALMFVDLNDFKMINDTHGHAIGDEVLRTIAARLKDITRDDDTVSRQGGDEFLYLLMEVKEQSDIALIAQKLITTIQSPCALSVGSLVIHASIGISIFPRDGTTAEALLQSADKAMYQAKRAKLGYVFAS